MYRANGRRTLIARAGPMVVLAALGAFALLPLMAPTDVAAQAGGSVRGTVTQAGTQRPLAGAQVFIKGTQRGRVSDATGVYLITGVPAGQVVVRVEMIGFRSSEQPVTIADGQTAAASFQLQESAIGLDEIVVTGTAGRTTKRALGNSISTVNAAELTEIAPITSVQNLLQGRTPGLSVMSSSGMAGGTARMRIRGYGSISASNEPVIYVDGVRISSGAFTLGNTSQGVNLLEAFNPNDIESIEVIKGPAAATLYGAEAAKGVIQIITKKGKAAEGLQWTANYEYGNSDWVSERGTTYWLCTDLHIDNPAVYPGCKYFTKSQPLSERLLVDHPLGGGPRSLAVIKQYEEKALAAEAAGNAALAARWRTQAFPCVFPQQEPCEPNPLRTGESRNLNMAVRGGGEAFNFYLSGEKSDENGTFYNNFNNRVGGRANFGFVPSPKANFSVNVGYVQLDQQTPLSDNASNGILRNAIRGQAGGAISQFLPGYRNFMPEFSNKSNNLIEFERTTMAVTTNYNPASWWQNKLTVGLDRNDRQVSSYDKIDQTGLAPNGITAATGTVSHDFNLVHQWTVDYAGTLSRELTPDISSAFSTGMQLQRRSSASHSISGNGLVANQLNLVSAAANRNASQGYSEQNSLGFFFQEMVGWKDRLFGTIAVRMDDNSAFGSNFSLVVYPKASVSYVISEADFFNVPWIDELKLRTAWGQAGNAPGPFSADRTYSTGRTVVIDAAANTISTAAFGNPDLKAETGQEIEGGFEASMLKGRLSANVTAYFKQTKDALLSVSTAPSSGWTGSSLKNVGEIRNSGLELALDANVLSTPKLNWDAVVSFATNANKLISFGKDAQGNPILNESRFGEFLSVQRHREGFPLGGYWATDVIRDAAGLPVLNAAGQATVVPCVWDVKDRSLCEEEYLGPGLPTRQIGLTNTFRIMNNLQVYAFLDYQGGHWQWCAFCSVRTRIDFNTEEFNDPRLDPSAPDYSTFGRYERARLLSLQTKEYIYRADFIKLRELSATYTLPRRFTSRAGFSKAAVTLAGRNLWLLTKYKGGTDPEVAFTSDSNFSNTDYAATPMMRRWQLSFNFNF